MQKRPSTRTGDKGRHLHPGTTGIVEPRSLAALRDSIELEIRQHAAMGRCGVVLTPGNYGAQFISGHFHLNGAPVVFISNFVGDAIDCCVREGFTNVLLVGHIGKLVKVAGGIMDTIRVPPTAARRFWPPTRPWPARARRPCVRSCRR